MSAPTFRAIGVVHTPFTNRDDTPLQPAFAHDVTGEVRFDPRYRDALDGVTGFTHLWLVTWLARFDEQAPEPELQQVPLLLRDDPKVLGIFATRGPRRPNPIGLSLVRVLSVEETTIRFAGVDLIDGTVVLDVKPYVTMFDQPVGDIQCGWFDDRLGTDNARLGSETGQGAHPCA